MWNIILYSNTHFHQQCTTVIFSPHHSQNLLFLVFLIIGIVTHRKWYLSMVLICDSLITSDLEASFHVPVGHLSIFFGEMFIQILCPFLNELCVFMLLSLGSSVCSLDINPFCVKYLQIFSPFYDLLFILLIMYLDAQKFLIFMNSTLDFKTFDLAYLLGNSGKQNHLYFWYIVLSFFLLRIVTSRSPS